MKTVGAWAWGVAVAGIGLAAAATSFAAPVVPGLHGKHRLKEAEVGELLLGELRCAACHRGSAESPTTKPATGAETNATSSGDRIRTAPDLSDVGARVAPEYLERFLAAPFAAHPGTTMPDVWGDEPETTRREMARALSHFLISRSQRRFERTAEFRVGNTPPDPVAGRALFHSIGCVACHSPRDDDDRPRTRAGVVDLSHLGAKYSHGSLAEFLFQPLRTRPAGRMPDMKLKGSEPADLAAYLLGAGPALKPADPATAPRPSEPDAELVQRGARYFRDKNCAACHRLEGEPVPPPAASLADVNPARGCLAPNPGRAPRFGLDDAQRRALRAALAKRGETATGARRLAITLTTFNCIGCHVRDDFGGVSEERNEYFRSDAKNLGDDARIPPPLTLAGAKLQTVWMKKVLFDGESVRPYMFARMPQYGEANVGHVPELFESLDSVEEFKMSLPDAESRNEAERNRARDMREAGRKLLGNASLNCVNCHNYNGKTPQNNGIELMTTPQRLRPSWFYHFVQRPSTYRPRIVMPFAWPGGEAVDKSVLGGDTDRQIEAIWYFLTLGTSAPDPSGVQPVDSKLAVGDAPRTYRGRSSVAGYRGIAIGFPEKWNYAFNAETGTLTALWRGDFVRVDRGGQGSGGFQPAARHVGLAQDVSFYRLPDEQAPWPMRPVMTKEQRVNPDPLYPKNRGYQFQGYYFDDGSVPTFQYRTGPIAIEDRSQPGAGEDAGRLVRTVVCDAPSAETIWFRALTGKVEAESPRRFRVGELRLTIPDYPTVVRPLDPDKGTNELLLRLELPAGKTQLALTYEILP